MATNHIPAAPMIKIGYVVHLIGDATAIGANGVERTLVGGDVIFSDDIIKTAANGAVVIEFDDGSRFDLGRNATAVLDGDVFDVHRLAEVQDAVVSAHALQAMIEAGIDPTAVGEATAAGEQTLEESSEPGVQLDRTAQLGEVTSGFETGGPAQGAGAQARLVDDSSLLFLATLPPAVDLDANDSSGAIGTGYEGTFVEDAGTVPIADSDTLIVNPHGNILTGATVTLTNAMAGDILTADGLPAGIQAQVDTSSEGRIVVHLSGDATLADYQTAIESIRFGNGSDAPDPSDRIIEVQVFDAARASEPAVATLHVRPVNDAPIAVDDTGTTDENQTLVLDVLANDHDPDGAVPLTLVDAAITDGGGTVHIEDGQLVFDPGTDFDALGEGETAKVTIEYTISDDEGATDTATATVTVTGTNDAPVAVDDSGTTTPQAPVVLDVLANDHDPDASDSLTLTDAAITDGGGTVHIEDGQLVFDPGHAFDALGEGETAEVRIQYTVADEHGATASAVATVAVTGTGGGGGSEDHQAPTVFAQPAFVHANVSETSSTYVEAGDRLPQLIDRPVEPDEVNGLGIIELAETREVTVKYGWAGGARDNTLGWYRIGEHGEIEDPQLIWENTDAREHGRDTVPNVSLGELEAGTRIGFFLVQNGAPDLPDNVTGLEFRNADGSQATIYDDGAQMHLFVDGSDTPVTERPIFHTAADAMDDTLGLNPDGQQHVISSPSASGSHMVIGFEDRQGDVSKDYDDLVFRVHLGHATVADASSGMNHVQVWVEDPDSTLLTQADVRIADGFQPGDQLVFEHGITMDPDGSLLRYGQETGLSVQNGGFDPASGSLTITGEGSIDLYEEVLNAVRVETDGAEDAAGTRLLTYSVADDTGLVSEVATVTLNLLSGDVTGSAGDDILTGTERNDLLFGSLGDDQIGAAGGDDILIGGIGDDLLTGGSGADTFVYRCNESGTDQITDYNAAEGDVLDISTLLSGTGASADNIDRFVQLTSEGELFVDKTGSGQFEGEAIATLQGIGSGDDVNLLLDTGTIMITGL